MPSTRIPPDGVIARAYVKAEETMTDGARSYMRDCLLRGMLEESLPEPKSEYKLNAEQKARVRERARSLLPEIALIREGEQPLNVEAAVTVEQEILPF